jgi:hypothetical protein
VVHKIRAFFVKVFAIYFFGFFLVRTVSLKLETLVVDSAIEHNPQLVAACRAKGVCGAPLKPACLGSECVGSCGCLQLNA